MGPEIIFIRPGPLEQIGDALVARLRCVFPENRFPIEWMPADIDATAFELLTRKMPMLAIGFDKIDRSQSGQELQVDSIWTILLVTQNKHSQRARLYGSESAPGLLTMLQAAAAALHRLAIPAAGTVMVETGQHLSVENWKDPNLAVATLTVRVRAEIAVASILTGDGVTGADLTTRSIEWGFGPSGAIELTDTIINTGTS